MALITPIDLGNWMQRPLDDDDDRATESINIAEGWLLGVTRLDPWPDLDVAPIPGDLRSWCLELAALAYVNNPRQMIQRQAGGVVTGWAPDALAQRQMILSAARTRYNTLGQPRSNFPPAHPWPEPALPWGAGASWYR